MINKKKIETWLAILAIAAIIIAWFTGRYLKDADIVSSIKAAMPEIAALEEIDTASFKIYNSEKEHVGYITIESSMGYGGPLQMAVAVDSNGKIFDLAVVNSKETPSYLDKVLNANFLDNVIGKSFSDEYSLGKDIDGISSATFSSRAIVEASKKGSRFVAGKFLGFDIPQAERPTIQFGAAEITLLLLFAVGFFAHKRTFKFTKIARWGTMLVGLFVIGFYYNKPFSLSMVNQLLLGYFPPIHSHIYWYLLIGGIIFVFTVDNKNPYCYWFCPFGAAQECLGVIGGARNITLGKIKIVFTWFLRIITLLAIIIALLFRNPGITSYEVFGTLFKLTGSNFQFALLGVVIVSSVFIKRPWCTYLCPLKPVTAHITHIRSWIIKKWKTVTA